MLATIDTGDDHSSINVVNPETYYKGREQWVKFKVTNADGRTITMNKKIVRYVCIKKKTAEIQRRNVINMKICLGQVLTAAPVNLVDRNHFKYQLLIGRSVLTKYFIVDAEHKHLTQTCVY